MNAWMQTSSGRQTAFLFASMVLAMAVGGVLLVCAVLLGKLEFIGTWLVAGLALVWITARYIVRRRVLGQLQESRQQLAAVIENTADGIVVLQDGSVSHVNRAALELFAVEEADVKGCPVSALSLSDPAQLRPSKSPRNALIRHQDGSVTAVELSCTTASTGHGVLTILTLRDATHHREIERRLTQAKDVAEAAHASQSRFVAAMSHELRTPLNAVLGYVQLLKAGGTFSGSDSARLDIIETSGQHLLSLVNDILDLAKNEAGKTELYVEEVNLADSIQAVCDIMRIKADEVGLSLLCDVTPDLPCNVVLDVRRLKQVLLNLLSNAVKFTERGTVELGVRLVEWRAAQRAVLRFVVKDTGVGIAPEQIKDIFLPFEQVGPAHGRDGGTGLGLTISRQLVQLMGSDIQVTSEPGLGTKFWFDVEVPVCTWPHHNSANRFPRGCVSCVGLQSRQSAQPVSTMAP